MSLVFCRLVLDISYIEFVSPLFEYAGMVYDFSIFKFLESYLLLSFYFFLVPSRVNRPSDIFLIFMLVFYLIPVGLFFSLAGGSRLAFYTINFCGLFCCLASNFPKITVPNIKFKNNFILELCITLLILITIFITLRVGLENINFDLTKEYDFRPIVSDLLSGYGMPYIIPWMTSVIGPFVLALSLKKKKYILFIIISLLHIFWFGITSHKTPMFIPLFVGVIWFLFSKRDEMYRIPLYSGLLLLFLTSLYFLFDYGLPASLIVRRLFLVPTMYSYEYFNFFENNHIFWSNAFFSGLSEYRYSDPFPKVIGEYAGTDDYANAGFIPAAFMHANFFGVMIYLFVYIIILKIIDGFCDEISDSWFFASFLLMLINIIITSADLPTTFLTHGLIVGLLLAWIYKSSISNSNRNA